MSIVDKIIEDLIKGAQASEGFMRGSRVNVEVQRHGEEQKLANHAGLGAGLGSLLGHTIPLPGGGIASTAAGAALGAEPGHRGGAALGALGGDLAGSIAGSVGGGALAELLHTNPTLLKQILGTAGGAAGATLGANKMSALDDACVAGVKAACERFGVKEAFLGAALPLLGSMAGPALARAGAARFAPGLAKAVSGGIGSHAFDMGASMLGGAMGQRMAGPQPA